MKQTTLLFTAVIALFMLSASTGCKPPRFTDPVAYNDSIIDRIDKNTDVLSALDDDLSYDDGSKINDSYKAAIDTVNKVLNYIKSMGEFKGYDDFRKAAETFVQNDLNRLNGGYKELVDEVVKYGADWPDDAIDPFNDKLKKIDDAGIADMDAFNTAQDKFATKFNFSVMHTPEPEKK